MTDKELRQLGKADLLKLLRDQEAEIAEWKEKVQELETSLQDRKIQIEKYGSLAEAALGINKVAEAAQAAADQYLENIRMREQHVEVELQKRQTEANQKIDAACAKTRENCARMERECQEKCKMMEEESSRKAAAYWSVLEDRLEKYYKSHLGLKEVLQASGIDIQIPNTKEGAGKEA